MFGDGGSSLGRLYGGRKCEGWAEPTRPTCPIRPALLEICLKEFN